MVVSPRLCLRRFVALLSLALFALLAADGNAAGEIVLLDFSSPHCGPCQQMRPIVRELIAAGYPIQEIDVLRESGLAAKYQISSVPCFVLLVDGQVADRVVGRLGRSDIEAMFRRAGNAADPGQMARGQSPDRPPLGQRLRDRITGVTAAPSSSPAVSPIAQNSGPPRGPSPTSPQGTQFASVPSPTASLGAVGPRSNPQQLIDTTVRIQVVDATGQSYGTGTIIYVDRGYAIVLTCGHLFRETRGQSPVAVDLFRATPQGPQVTATVQGQVLRYDLDRDVGLIRIETNSPVMAARIAPEGSRPQSGDSVVSVGCDHGQAPTIRDSHITTIDRYSGPSNIETTGAPVEGRSGGGLFNGQGQLIGVCFAADERGNEGLYSGLLSIYEELRRAGIAVGNNATTPMEPANLPGSQTAVATAGPTVPAPLPILQPSDRFASNRSLDGNQPLASDAPSATNLVAVTPQTPPASLRPAEHAALEEVSRRADGAEVIFIIRSKEPGGKTEIITLEDASPEFIATLLGAARGESRTRLTSHAVATLPPRPTTGTDNARAR